MTKRSKPKAESRKPKAADRPTGRPRRTPIYYCTRCLRPVQPAYHFTVPMRCENCWAEDQDRYHGHDQSVARMIAPSEDAP